MSYQTRLLRLDVVIHSIAVAFVFLEVLLKFGRIIAFVHTKRST